MLYKFIVVASRDCLNLELKKFLDMNTIGRIFRLTTFGESHGKSIGGIFVHLDLGNVDSYKKVLDI